MNNIFFHIIDFFVQFTIVSATIVGIRNLKNKVILYPIFFYILVSLFNDIFLTIFEYLPQFKYSQIISTVEINIFNIISFSLFINFFYRIMTSEKNKVIVIIIYFLYIIFCLGVYLILPKTFISFLPPLYAVGFLFIVVVSLIYILEILNSDLDSDFKSNPVFIAVCGILFYSSVTIPMFFFSHIIYEAANNYYLIYNGLIGIFLILLFFTFIKAFLCPLPEQKLS